MLCHAVPCCVFGVVCCVPYCSVWRYVVEHNSGVLYPWATYLLQVGFQECLHFILSFWGFFSCWRPTIETVDTNYMVLPSAGAFKALHCGVIDAHAVVCLAELLVFRVVEWFGVCCRGRQVRLFVLVFKLLVPVVGGLVFAKRLIQFVCLAFTGCLADMLLVVN